MALNSRDSAPVSPEAAQSNYRYLSTKRYREHILYCLTAEKEEGGSWTAVATSEPFTTDAAEAERYAEICTRNNLSPLHLDEVIDDLQTD